MDPKGEAPRKKRYPNPHEVATGTPVRSPKDSGVRGYFWVGCTDYDPLPRVLSPRTPGTGHSQVVLQFHTSMTGTRGDGQSEGGGGSDRKVPGVVPVVPCVSGRTWGRPLGVGYVNGVGLPLHSDSPGTGAQGKEGRRTVIPEGSCPGNGRKTLRVVVDLPSTFVPGPSLNGCLVRSGYDRGRREEERIRYTENEGLRRPVGPRTPLPQRG